MKLNKKNTSFIQCYFWHIFIYLQQQLLASFASHYFLWECMFFFCKNLWNFQNSKSFENSSIVNIIWVFESFFKTQTFIFFLVFFIFNKLLVQFETFLQHLGLLYTKNFFALFLFHNFFFLFDSSIKTSVDMT